MRQNYQKESHVKILASSGSDRALNECSYKEIKPWHVRLREYEAARKRIFNVVNENELECGWSKVEKAKLGRECHAGIANELRSFKVYKMNSKENNRRKRVERTRRRFKVRKQHRHQI